MGDTSGVPDSLWKALFEWSIRQQDGTSTSSTSSSTAAPLSDADRQWLEEALAAGMVDLSKQLVEIKTQLEANLPDAATEEEVDRDRENKARLLDELLDLVESIDQAKDLSTIGGLATLLHVIDGGVPSLQWRAAEVIGTCAQNNPEVQASFFRDGVMPKLWDLLSSPDATCRLKALLAVSCLLRGSAEVQAWWSAQDGVGKIVGLLSRHGEAGEVTDDAGSEKDNTRIVRKCLQILNYLVENPTVQDRDRLASLSAEIERVLVRVISDSRDHDVEVAAIDLGKRLGLQSVFQNPPDKLLEAVQLYLASFDVYMHDKKEDWACVEENVVCAKALLEVLKAYRPAAAGSASPSAMQLVAITDRDGEASDQHE